MNDGMRLTIYLLLGLFGGLFVWHLVALFVISGQEQDNDPWMKQTYAGGIEKVNEQTANVTVNGRTFTVAQNRSGIHVQETTGGRHSAWVTMSESSARFGKTKPQAAARYIQTIVDEGHRIP